MNRKVTAVAALAAIAVTLVTVAAAAPVAAKQNVAIQIKGAFFVLTPLTSGALERDSGTVAFCCWSSQHVVRDGQAIDISTPQMTLTDKHGTLVARNRIEWVDLPDGWSIFTGTWKAVGGTGSYGSLSGRGGGAGVHNSSGFTGV